MIKGRGFYTQDDEEAMYAFLIKELKRSNPDARNPNGNLIWEKASREHVTRHSVQSMTTQWVLWRLYQKWRWSAKVDVLFYFRSSLYVVSVGVKLSFLGNCVY